MLFLGGDALRAGPLADAHRIAAATGARLMAETFFARMERGRGRFAIDRLPYNVEPGLAALAGIRHLILVGADDPVAFFAYPDMPGRFAPPEADVTTLAAPGEDSAGRARPPRRSRSRAPDLAPPPTRRRRSPATGAVTNAALGQTLAALLPENAVVVEEGVTFGFGLYPPMADAAPHDSSAMSAARSATACRSPPAPPSARRAAASSASRPTAPPSTRCRRCGPRPASASTSPPSSCPTAATPSSTASSPRSARRPARPRAPSSTSAIPTSTGSSIANGFGVEAARAETMESFADVFAHANSRPGPFLIELVIP